jgi:sugar (pentulose or hexulose) kinase
MKPLPVILIFDVGKTNKKMLLFDEQYAIVYKESVRFEETRDEDGFPCEDINALRDWITSSLERMLLNPQYTIKAINFSAYGASFVYIDETGKPILPLYNYLKPYPELLLEEFYSTYGGKEEFARRTASPVLGSLNSGLQFYRIKYEKPEVFKKIKYALHLPQYLSFILTGKPTSEITSIGCHTNLWDFTSNHYHDWVAKENLDTKLPLIDKSDRCFIITRDGKSILTGIGLHDSSAALIPYLNNFHEPFILLSTGTWSISLNPFNYNALSEEELKKDCLCYLTYKGRPVKASRIFAGHEHEQQVKRLSDYYGLSPESFNTIKYDAQYFKNAKQIRIRGSQHERAISFSACDLSTFEKANEAYHELMIDMVAQQLLSTELVLRGTNVKRLFVDGGFSKNSIYMHLMASIFPELEVFAASAPQASALGAALAIHKHWNNNPFPSDCIALKYYSDTNVVYLSST